MQVLQMLVFPLKFCLFAPMQAMRPPIPWIRPETGPHDVRSERVERIWYFYSDKGPKWRFLFSLDTKRFHGCGRQLGGPRNQNARMKMVLEEERTELKCNSDYQQHLYQQIAPSTWLILDKLKTHSYLCCLAANHTPTSSWLQHDFYSY